MSATVPNEHETESVASQAANSMESWSELAMCAARDFGTPCYLSRWNPILRAVEAQEARFPAGTVRSWLSFKTHPVRPLARAWVDSGRGVEVVSEAEFVAIKSLGVGSDRLLVNGVAKHHWLAQHEMPGLRVHFDSPAELVALLPPAVQQRWRVGLRCQVPAEHDARDSRFRGQFGLTETEVARASIALPSASWFRRSPVPELLSQVVTPTFWPNAEKATTWMLARLRLVLV